MSLSDKSVNAYYDDTQDTLTLSPGAIHLALQDILQSLSALPVGAPTPAERTHFYNTRSIADVVYTEVAHSGSTDSAQLASSFSELCRMARAFAATQVTLLKILGLSSADGGPTKAAFAQGPIGDIIGRLDSISAALDASASTDLSTLSEESGHVPSLSVASRDASAEEKSTFAARRSDLSSSESKLLSLCPQGLPSGCNFIESGHVPSLSVASRDASAEEKSTSAAQRAIFKAYSSFVSASYFLAVAVRDAAGSTLKSCDTSDGHDFVDAYDE